MYERVNSLIDSKYFFYYFFLIIHTNKNVQVLFLEYLRVYRYQFKLLFQLQK